MNEDAAAASNRTARVRMVVALAIVVALIAALFLLVSGAWYDWVKVLHILAVIAWMSAPLTLGLMLALVVATFHHLQLGLQVVIEDYVHHEPAKMVSLLLMKGACMLLGLVCIVSVLKIGL